MTTVKCWFCEEREASLLKNTYNVVLFGDVQRQRGKGQTTRLTWKNKTISIPRCFQCKAAHEWNTVFLVLGILLSIGAFIGIILINPYSGWGWLAAIVGAGVTGGVVWGGAWKIISRITGTKFNQQSARIIHPDVKRAINDGWTVGKRPTS